MVATAPHLTTAGLGAARYAVVDVETSGLSRRRHRVLQVAIVVTTANGTVVDRWASLVRPRWGRFGRVGPTHVHGLTARHLRSAPPFAAVAPDIVRRLDGAVFVAHNAAFDWAFVSRSLRRVGYPPPDAARLCTMRLSRAVAPAEPSHRLVDVCARYGVVIARPHDALADAEAAAAVLPSLLAEPHAPDAVRQQLGPRGTAWRPWRSPGRWRRLYRWSW
jgi:DNA polymerase-3 subunit epsilon